MTIYLHPNRDDALASAYLDAFKTADEIFVLSAYLREWRDFDVGGRCKNATLIVGKDFGITRKQALRDALAWKERHGDRCHAFVAYQINGFHPKLVMWKTGDKCYVIIGSSNLTKAAFESNYEANILTRVSHTQYRAIGDWIAQILGLSRPITEKWIKGYEEAPNKNSFKGGKPTPHNTTELSDIVLPQFPTLAQALAERKERVYAFEDIRKDFESVVRLCAAGKLSQPSFYDWLIENWNGADWKFQGSGIFRHKPTSTDWQMLCAALVQSLDSPKATRDQLISVAYDHMEISGRVEVRKAFLTEMLCHFYPDDYPLWNNPVRVWLEKTGVAKERPRGLTAGAKYIWLATQLRQALQSNPEYPAKNLAELDHVVWAYCKHMGWTKRDTE